MSNLEVGIVGLPNVGKSTLFNAITKAGAEAANYPFCTIEPNVGVVNVPDERLNVLTKMYNSKKTTPASVRFVDIAGPQRVKVSATSSWSISDRLMLSLTLSVVSRTATLLTLQTPLIRCVTLTQSILNFALLIWK